MKISFIKNLYHLDYHLDYHFRFMIGKTETGFVKNGKSEDRFFC